MFSLSLHKYAPVIAELSSHPVETVDRPQHISKRRNLEEVDNVDTAPTVTEPFGIDPPMDARAKPNSDRKTSSLGFTESYPDRHLLLIFVRHKKEKFSKEVDL